MKKEINDKKYLIKVTLILLILILILAGVVTYFAYFRKTEPQFSPLVIVERKVLSLGGNNEYKVSITVQTQLTEASVVLEDIVTNGNILQTDYGFVNLGDYHGLVNLPQGNKKINAVMLSPFSLATFEYRVRSPTPPTFAGTWRAPSIGQSGTIGGGGYTKQIPTVKGKTGGVAK